MMDEVVAYRRPLRLHGGSQHGCQIPSRLNLKRLPDHEHFRALGHALAGHTTVRDLRGFENAEPSAVI